MTEDEVPTEVENSTETDIEEATWGDRLLVHGKPLSPRHKKLAELAAQGFKPGEIATKLGYTGSRVSILLSNTLIRQEIARVQERIYEDTVAKRLKELATPAMDEIQTCLADETNKYPKALKVSTAIWAAEMLHGKATQKTELSGSILGGVMDRLDAMKTAGKIIEMNAQNDEKVELLGASDAQFEELKPVLSKTEEELAQDWVLSYNPKT